MIEGSGCQTPVPVCNPSLFIVSADNRHAPVASREPWPLKLEASQEDVM